MKALQDIVVVELCEGVAGEFCGKLLADFGAAVVKIERPGTGSPTRRFGPAIPGAAPGEDGTAFAYLNTNKFSVAADAFAPQGQALIADWIARADVVLDDHARAWQDKTGLSAGAITSLNAAAVLCHISPFGPQAPADHDLAQSLNVFHSSGWGYHTPSQPDESKPPLKGAGRFMADYEAGLDAALCVVASLYWRTGTGSGQAIALSQQAVLASRLDYVLGQIAAGSLPACEARGAFDLGGPATIFPCQDGYIYGWMSEASHWRALADLLDHPAWMERYPEDWLELHITDARVRECRSELRLWLADKRKDDVSTRAQQLGLPFVPVNTAADLLSSPQFQHRGFFAALDHPVQGPTPYPTVPYLLSETPARLELPAPALGEHTASLRPAMMPRPAAPRPLAEQPRAAEDRGGPLSGVRVVELTRVWAGPYTGKLLAYLGAEVIKVESNGALDITRRYGRPEENGAPGFKSINPQKKSVQLDLRSAEGLALMKQLIAKSDIFIENLRPGAIARAGLDYARLQTVKPDIIAVSMKMYGAAGPLAYQSGYAPCFAALGGISNLVGYRGDVPAGMNLRYGDSTFGAAAAYAATVALMHHQRTGQGQFIDVSAIEAMAAMIGDVLLGYAFTGQLPECDGNEHAEMAPHGCYPCRDGAWLSIAAPSETSWTALCGVIDPAGRLAGSEFASLPARLAHLETLETVLAELTRGWDAAELEVRLRGVGVPAFKSNNSIDLISHELLWKSGFYRHVRDSAGKPELIVGAPWIMLGASAAIDHAAPDLGQHNREILRGVLGLSEEAIADLIARKVVD